MSPLDSFILGLVQGVGEFLPISSSAHLVILPLFLHIKDPGLAFSVALHFGTLIALAVFFWRDWWFIGRDFCLYTRTRSPAYLPNFRLLLYLVVATIPGAMAGYFLDDVIETWFRHPFLVALNMTFLALVLLWAEVVSKKQRNMATISFRDSILIGLSQMLALVPGVSRAGITMTTGLFVGLDRVTAARFSFLMAAPIIFGACVLKLPDFFSVSSADLKVTLFGIAVAAIVGFLSIRYLLKFLVTYSFKIFVYYRFAFTIVVLVYIFT